MSREGMMPLKVLDYTLREGGTGRLALIAASMGQQQPEVVALLEANRHANALSLAKAQGMDCAFGPANNAFPLAWMSRLTIL